MEAETERLIIRRFTTADAERMFEIYSDRETMKYQNGGPDTVQDEFGALERHIANYYDKRGYGLFGVVRKQDGTLLGRCGIVRQEVEGESMEELSYLLDRNYWNCGYATEAAQAVANLAFEKFELKKLIALIHPDNIASVRVAEKCGFELERMLPRYKKFENVCLYSRTR